MPAPPSHSQSEAPRLAIRRFADFDALTAALAQRLEALLTARATAIMLSGGNTPLPAYRLLAARKPRAAAGLVLLYSDERYVPASSAASNYHQTAPLLDALALPAAQVLRVATELPLAQAAADYEQKIDAMSARGMGIGLGLLGLGADGHTASLFDAGDIERARGRRAIAVHRPDGRDAVTVTPTVLERIAELVFVVTGEDKRTALAAFMARSPRLAAFQAIAGCGAAEIWTDPLAWPT
jgi:6-phosphogluconolactonase